MKFEKFLKIKSSENSKNSESQHKKKNTLFNLSARKSKIKIFERETSKM